MSCFKPITAIYMLCIIFGIIGCASKNIIEISAGSGFKKKIAVLPVEERGLKDEKLKLLFQKSLTDNIERICPAVILIKPEEAKSLQLFEKTDNISLSEAGKAAGLNAVVRTGLGTLVISKEEKGFPMFKRLRNSASINAAVEIYDTVTAAKLLDQSLTRNSEPDDADIELIKAGKDSGMFFLGNTLSDMAAEFAVKICNTVSDQPWQSFIVSVSKSILTLSCGKNTGIQPGDLLDVYDRGELLNGAEGQRFFKPGPKVGEIKIIAIYPDRAEAIPFTGKDFREGSSVRQK